MQNYDHASTNLSYNFTYFAIFFGYTELQLQLYEGYYGMCVYELCYWVASNFTLNLVKTT